MLGVSARLRDAMTLDDLGLVHAPPPIEADVVCLQHGQLLRVVAVLVATIGSEIVPAIVSVATDDGLLAGGGREKPVILLGDMNDEANAATTLILNGPPGSEIGSVGFDQPDQGDGDRMWNTAELIREDRRFTRLYRGRMELIDHIFVSHFLVSGTRITRSRLSPPRKACRRRQPERPDR